MGCPLVRGAPGARRLSVRDHRPGDCTGWATLSPELKAYERERAGPAHDHDVRPQDLAELEALLDA